MPTTRLDIINSMLAANGSDPVTADDSNHPDVIAALPVLNKCNKNMQGTSWWFNQEYSLTLLPSQTGEILLPANCIAVDPVDKSSWLVMRGSRLYDPKLHTFNIGVSVLVDMRVELPVEQLPQIAAQYLEAYAIHSFYVNDDGDDNKSAQYLRERNIAFTAMKKEDLASKDLNATNRPTVAAILGGIRPAGGLRSSNPRYPGGRS